MTLQDGGDEDGAGAEQRLWRARFALLGFGGLDSAWVWRGAIKLGASEVSLFWLEKPQDASSQA